MDSLNWKTALCAGGSAVLCVFAYKIFSTKVHQKCGGTYSDVLFFYGSEDGETSATNPQTVKRLTRMIRQAKSSIDVCVPRVNDTLKNCLLEIQFYGDINIRVISHNYLDNYGNLFPLIKRGIAVKVNKSLYSLEHEFILIDANRHHEGMVVVGSLCFEEQLYYRNYVILTSDETILNGFKNEFNRIWYTVKTAEIMQDEDSF